LARNLGHYFFTPATKVLEGIIKLFRRQHLNVLFLQALNSVHVQYTIIQLHVAFSVFSFFYLEISLSTILEANLAILLEFTAFVFCFFVYIFVRKLTFFSLLYSCTTFIGTDKRDIQGGPEKYYWG